ncbi:small RNA-binding protein 11, chloroplastic [Vitis vinifera]|nr:small RNA-binding protein 11, chloroplastic [Vitis vinifera]|eukprot:XP_003632289.2 PREDICTED: glycine-rich RNA-binding protein 4, mitochondrial [Vitis vinifera]
MMASFRGISDTFLRFSSLNPYLLSSQLIFCRGIASTLFVKGISFSTTEKTLAEAFSQFGEVVEAKIIMDKRKLRPKGFAYVTFTREDEAEKALTEMNGKVVDGRTVLVDYAM